MPTKNDKFFNKGVELEKSFANQVRDMEETIKSKLLSININNTSEMYIVRMVKAVQVLHDLNKHH